MRLSLAAALAITMILAGAAGAQENYTIRPTYHSNLRTEPSLGAAVFETVIPALPLLVVGESGDWLEIKRFRETVYMANWVPYTVVGHGERLTIESEFADITCAAEPTSERYGNTVIYIFGGLCVVTRISDIESLPEAADADDKEASADDEASQTSETQVAPTPPDLEQDMEMDGLEAVIEQVKTSLLELYEISPAWYAYVADVTDKIIGFEENPSSPYFKQNAAAYVYPHTRTMYIGDYAALEGFGSRERDIGLASLLVHEACHIHQYDAGLTLTYPDREIMCNVAQLKLIDGLRAPEVKGHLNGFIVRHLYLNDATSH